MKMSGEMSVAEPGGSMNYIGGDSGGDYNGDMEADMGMDMGVVGEEIPFSPMTSVPFIVGISVLSMAIAIGVGIVIAKLKIKKGLDLYED